MAENEVNEAEASTEDQTTGEDSAAPAQDEQQPAEQQVPLAALQSEREKRQNAEQRLQTLERAVQQGQMQQPQQPQPQQPELTNDAFFENPLGYMNAFQQQTKNDLRNEFSEQAMIREVGQAEYNQKLQHFATLARVDPSLSNQLAASRDPARFVYNHAKADLQGFTPNDPQAIYDKALADAEAKLRAEYEQKLAASQGTAEQDLPNSLATAPAAGGASSSDVLPNTDLKSLYNGR